MKSFKTTNPRETRRSMVRHDPLLKTRQVAEAYGVSVSTIKRWVDAGVLQASRTVGKHRLVALTEALRHAKDQGLPVEGLNRWESAGGLVRNYRLGDRTTDALVQALSAGETQQARTILLSAHASSQNAAEVADRLIRPAMERVGHSWSEGNWDVFQEHQATQVMISTLVELIERASPARGRLMPLAMGATPEGDLYSLALLLGELVLRESGWEVRNLGSNLPLDSLARAALEYEPELIFLSVSFVQDEDRFTRDYQKFSQAADSVGAAVMIGGRALGPDLRARLAFAGLGERMAHLSEFARRIAPEVQGRPRIVPSRGGSTPSRNDSTLTVSREDRCHEDDATAP